MAAAPGHPHRLVADAEFALVGRGAAARCAGPRGRSATTTATTRSRHDYPVFQVDARLPPQDAIFPATVVGKPRQEDFFLGDYLQELLSPLFPLVMPSRRRPLELRRDTGFHSLAAAVVRERYPREAMASAFRILGEGQLSLTKFLLADRRAARPARLRGLARARARARRVRRRTSSSSRNLSMDTLDYTGPKVNEGSKGVLLGLGDADPRAAARVPAGALPAGCDGALPSSAPRLPRRRGPAFADGPGARRAARRATRRSPTGRSSCSSTTRRATAQRRAPFLWTTFTRFEPAADLHAAASRVVRNHLAFAPPVVIDARMKPWMPRSCRGGSRDGRARRPPLARVLPEALTDRFCRADRTRESTQRPEATRFGGFHAFPARPVSCIERGRRCPST